MDMKAFVESEWFKAARDPQALARVLQELPTWLEKAQNSELIARAKRLWYYLKSEKSSKGDIIIAVAALLYLISPIDAFPDFIPVLGWLDDVAIAGLVLGYLDNKASEHQGPNLVN